MTTSDHSAMTSLKHELETLSQQEFSGRLDVDAHKEQWHLYFTMGRLVWAGGGVHWFRRWHRCLHQYCPEVDRLNIETINSAQNNDYLLLIQWIKQQQITGAQAASIIRSTAEEVLFDILQQAEKEELRFAHIDPDTIDTPLTLLNSRHVLESAQKAWEFWSREGLAALSPNLALFIGQPEQLQQHPSYKLHQPLIAAIDGQRTLRELALLLSQEPSWLIQKLGLYLQEGWIELIEVPDQIPISTSNSSPAEGSGNRNSKSVTAIASGEQTTAQPLSLKSTLPNASQSAPRFLPFGKWALPTLAVLVLGGGYAIWRSQSNNVLNPIGGGMLPSSPGQLTMVGTDFSGHSTFRSSAFQEVLKQAGLTLNYQVASDEQSAKLLNQGSADLELTTLDQFLQHQSQGKIVGLINHSVGGDAVVLNTKRYPGLKSLLDLEKLLQQARSQKQQLDIVLPQNTPGEYLVMVLGAEFEGLKLSDFHVNKTANAAEDWKLLHDNRQNVVAAVLREPDVTHARQEGYSVALSSQDVPEEIVDVLIASNSLMQSQPETIAKLLEAYYRRVDADARDASQLKQHIAQESNLSPADATAVMQGIQFFSALEARDWLKNGKLEKRISATSAILVLAGRINQVPQAKALFTPQFVNQAATNTESLIRLVRADNPKLADRLAGKAVSTKSAPNLNPMNPEQIKNAPIIGDLKLQWDVKFDAGSVHLTKAGQQAINRLAQEISAEFNPQTVAVEVIGHTSQDGSAVANQILSQNRAQVVVDQFKRLGLPHAIIAEGKGFSDPLPEIPPTDSRNQRTEIRLVHFFADQ
ncbi:MAG: phosphate ABC transporter substrate-binding/OmpA family protein [Thermosynechococcaceae cyanobacterium]